jgi:hypothetical protein
VLLAAHPLTPSFILIPHEKKKGNRHQLLSNSAATAAMKVFSF